MFGINEIRYMNSAMGSGCENAISASEAAARYLGVVKVKRAANNSWLVMLQDGGAAYIHVRTQVVYIHPDGAVTLDSGGWETVTTKDRLNRFQDVCGVYSERGRWVVRVHKTGELVPFSDGMLIRADGRVEDINGRQVPPVFHGGEVKAARLGNLVTEGIERWGAAAGYWPEMADRFSEDQPMFELIDKIEAEGVERGKAWDIMDPHVHPLGDMAGQEV
jgi:hypothetical protein